MTRRFVAGLALGLITIGSAGAAETVRFDSAAVPDDQTPVYVQIIVKACPPAETPLEPINQGKVYDDEKPLTLAERKAALVAQGCIDVPIPMEWMTQEMTPEACRGHAGYLAAMQFLEQRHDLAGMQAVGAWECVVTDHQVIGAVSQ
jgi:hypothetical protein